MPTALSAVRRAAAAKSADRSVFFQQLLKLRRICAPEHFCHFQQCPAGKPLFEQFCKENFPAAAGIRNIFAVKPLQKIRVAHPRTGDHHPGTAGGADEVFAFFYCGDVAVGYERQGRGKPYRCGNALLPQGQGRGSRGGRRPLRSLRPPPPPSLPQLGHEFYHELIRQLKKQAWRS